VVGSGLETGEATLAPVDIYEVRWILVWILMATDFLPFFLADIYYPFEILFGLHRRL
jgi:hypothetical protein